MRRTSANFLDRRVHNQRSDRMFLPLGGNGGPGG
jgi:hypothetical protein